LSCLFISKKSIERQGGYYELPEKNFEGMTAYYFAEGKKSVPTLETISKQIEAYANNTVCRETVTGNMLKSKAHATIGDGFVRVSVEADSIYNVEISSDLKHMLGLADEIVENEIKHKGMVDLGMLSDINITASTVDGTMVYEIGDGLLQKKYTDAVLRFATKW